MHVARVQDTATISSKTNIMRLHTFGSREMTQLISRRFLAYACLERFVNPCVVFRVPAAVQDAPVAGFHGP